METLIVGDVQLRHVHQESLLTMNVDGHTNHASQVDGMDDNVDVQLMNVRTFMGDAM
jgi:hypothetical protein